MIVFALAPLPLISHPDTLQASARKSSTSHPKRQRTPPSLEPVVVVPTKRPKVNRIDSDSSGGEQEYARARPNKTGTRKIPLSDTLVTPRKRQVDDVPMVPTTAHIRRVAQHPVNDSSTDELGSAGRLEESGPSGTSSRRVREVHGLSTGRQRRHDQTTISNISKASHQLHRNRPTTSRLVHDDLILTVKSEPLSSPLSGSSEEGKLGCHHLQDCG